MNLKNNIKRNIIEVVCLLYVLLFVYASVSKLLDFENFQVQLGQSPLLSAFASWMSWLVPIIELVISIVLMIPKYRIIGLFASLNLMIMFTAYIFIILHYSSFVPCSCGGILEKMSWNVHLVFNVVFVLLAIIALVLNEKLKVTSNISLHLLKSIAASIIFSTGLIVVLFYCSEEIMHYKNPFVRRYIRQSAEFVQSKDLKFNSYYFSGYNNGEVFLGNYTTPLKVLRIDSTFKILKTSKIDYKNQNIPFRLVKVLARGEYFYLMDGTVPCIYFGHISDWKIMGSFNEIPNFTALEPMDSSTFVFRNNTGMNSANILGIYSAGTATKIQYQPKLLQKQIDGIFDTDGMLLFNEGLRKIVFVYYYRNEFVIADENGKLIRRGHTIDTISKAKIKVAYLKGGVQRKMAAPPLTVNAVSATHNNLLFIESRIQGMYENDPLWKHAAIIDVYDLKKRSYVLSFPVFGTEEYKLKSLLITDTHLYGIIDTKLVVYRFKGILKQEIKK
ncbi:MULTISPECIES: MauE/DoxX family redox-associated membrane protein [unclassified Flavobacterium]|uniref:MauE/DoxX family redox-associated membrane protein n=1 Tax=Flavobacterium sp. 90 TaxID=2135622 RepID=UPI000EAD6122|nr:MULTISPECIES: MauE/DoxX family redox-associated membrane protein [unclassified Flavobacterium]